MPTLWVSLFFFVILSRFCHPEPKAKDLCEYETLCFAQGNERIQCGVPSVMPFKSLMAS